MYTSIKNLISFSGEKKKSAYQQDRVVLRGVPGRQDRLGRTGSRNLEVLKKILRRRRAAAPNIYTSEPPRKRGRKLIRGVVAGIAILMFYFCGGNEIVLKRLQKIEFFKVTKIAVSGNSTVSYDKLRTTADIVALQTSLLGMNTAVIEKKLMEIPWIAGAKVSRDWPSTVRIEVVENSPLALMHHKTANGSELRYIDKYGHSFLSVSPGSKVDLPVVTGLSEIKNREIYDSALGEVLIFLNKVKTNDPHLPVQSLSEVHVTPEGNLVIYLVEYPFPIFFGNGNTKQKYGRLVEVLKALYKKEKGKDLISEVEYIQMDYLQDKVLVAQSGQG